MCYQIYHQCRYCKNQYECALENYICPTINHDEDMEMCDLCRAREAESFRKALERNEIPEDKPISIEDWDNQ